MKRTLLLFALVLPVLGQSPPALRGLSRQFEDLVDRVDPAVVQIVTRGFGQAGEGPGTLLRSTRGGGSGVIVDPSGYIITNAHVINGARQVQVLLPQPSEDTSPGHSVLKPTGKLLAAEVVGVDRETDIAVLKVSAGKLPVLAFGDSERVRQGQIVFAFGSPLGLENSVTMGVVSSVARQVRPDDPMIYIQTDASINPGNSGGPLVDTEGQLVGINTFILSQGGGNEGIGFAAPSSIVKSVYEQIREFGRVRRGQVGIVLQTITPLLAEAMKLPRDWGAIVGDVAPDSAAAAAGLEVKDILLTVDGKVIENARQFGVTVYRQAGKTITVELLRGGQKMEKRIAVLERPRDPARIVSLLKGAESRVPRLGLLAVDLDENVTRIMGPLRKLRGVVVAGVVLDLAVEESRLQQGDAIYEINGEPVSSVGELREKVKALPHGQVVVLSIERQGQLQLLLWEVD
jgi:serine protease Do